MQGFDMTLQMRSLGKCSPTVSTDKWSLAQMNPVNMLLEITTIIEELSTGIALERLQLEMDSVVMI